MEGNKKPRCKTCKFYPSSCNPENMSEKAECTIYTKDDLKFYLETRIKL